MSGSMAQRSVGHVGQGERAAVVRHEDHLRMEGSMEGRHVGTQAARGERYGVVRREDNLRVEGGKFEGRAASAAAATTSLQNGNSAGRTRTNTASSIVMGDGSSMVQRSNGTSAKTASASASSTSKSASSSSRVASSTSKATSSKATASSSKATASSLVLAGGEAAGGLGGIAAVNRDAFASSLRESAGVAVGAQKEMSVIEHHRKHSQQQQAARELRSTSYSISSHAEQGGSLGAHTGRTSAYGGRDYEYSANLANSSTSRRQSSISQQQQQSYSASSQQSSSHGQQSSSQGQQSSSRAMDLMGGFNARQVAGYGASRQTGATLIQQGSTSASAYQSTAANSYKGAQLESSRRSSTGRKTWAESSLQHSQGAMGQSLYAQDFHQHSCPASKVYTDTSPFKYERQSSSGHKIFRQADGSPGGR